MSASRCRGRLPANDRRCCCLKQLEKQAGRTKKSYDTPTRTRDHTTTPHLRGKERASMLCTDSTSSMPLAALSLGLGRAIWEGRSKNRRKRRHAETTAFLFFFSRQCYSGRKYKPRNTSYIPIKRSLYGYYISVHASKSCTWQSSTFTLRLVSSFFLRSSWNNLNLARPAVNVHVQHKQLH